MSSRTATAPRGSPASSGPRDGAAGLESRGALLREVSRLSSAVVTAHGRCSVSSATLEAAASQVAALRAQVREADAELTEAEAARVNAAEAGDAELTSLQRVGGALAARRAELVRAAKAARGEREARAEAARAALWRRLGAASEAAAVVAPHLPGGPDDFFAPAPVASADVWTAPAVALLQAAEALWKRVSTQGEAAADVLSGALALDGARLAPPPAQAATTATPSAAPARTGVAAAASAGATGGATSASAALDDSGLAAAALYRVLGPTAVASDAERASAGVAGLTAEAARLSSEVEAAAAAAGGGGGALAAVRAIVEATQRNLRLQGAALLAVSSRPLPAAASASATAAAVAARG